jgi:hypothetical protein
MKDHVIIDAKNDKVLFQDHGMFFLIKRNEITDLEGLFLVDENDYTDICENPPYDEDTGELLCTENLMMEKYINQFKKMKEGIIIQEVCEDGSFSKVYDYDNLPKEVKEKVDKALKNDNAITCDIYKYGLQHLMSIKHPDIKAGETIKLKGNVIFYDTY